MHRPGVEIAISRLQEQSLCLKLNNCRLRLNLQDLKMTDQIAGLTNGRPNHLHASMRPPALYDTFRTDILPVYFY